MPDRLGVLRDPSYRLFWIGQSVSFIGSHVTELALPLTAVLLLNAGPGQMGVLTALEYVPFLLIGLIVGVWVDRTRRRPILIGADLVGAAAIGLIPLAALLGVLRIELMYAVAFVFGLIEVIAPVAYQSFVPTLVGRDRLVEGNAKLEASHSVAAIVGPGLGGALIQALTAPIALVIDTLSYLVSAAALTAIRLAEPPPIPAEHEATIRQQIAEGLRLVLARPTLRALVACGAIHNFFSRMIDALLVLYAVDVIGLGPAEIGLVFAAGGPGSLVGALTVEGLGRRLGVGRVILASQVVTGLARLMVPAAALVARGPAAVTVLAMSMFLLGFVRTTFNITQVSLRVAITEDRMHGRVNATMRFVMWGVTPFGAVAGGLLAASGLGLDGTLALAGVGVLLAFVPLLTPAIRTVASIPSAAVS
ncbi:MAG TPA: MFS transporter [Candidatus Limnocylindrales bacterium]|nr:MFS transporter [Candidatus Limnocylindrales bacterium]